MSNTWMLNIEAKRETPGRLYAGENPEERVARRRQQFMDAGLQVFGTVGYRGATVRMLCKQAELTDRYFYESFESTEDLLIAVYKQQFDQLQHAVVRELLQATPESDVMDTVRSGLNTLLDMSLQPCVARVCWREVLGVSQRVDDTYLETSRGFANLIIGVARTRMPHWRISDDEVGMLGLALIGAVNQTVTHWMLGNYRERKETLIAAISRVFEGVMLTAAAKG